MGWRHLLWDMGGTLIDTYPSVDRTFADLCARCGLPITADEVARLTRLSIAEAGEELADRCGVAATEFEEAYAALKRSWRHAPPPVMAGARELMARAKALGGLNIIVTHRDRESASSLLKVHGLAVDDLICAPDGHPRKPDPTMLRLAIQRHGLDPAAGVAIGDRAIDARAADAAGLAWAVLRTPETQGLDGLLVDDLSELLPRLG